MIDYTDWWDKVKKTGFQILFNVGEWDMRDGSAGMIWLKNLGFWEFLNCTEIWDSEKKIYYVKQADGTFATGGIYRESDVCQVTLLTVPKAGHFVPYGNF